MEPSTITSDAGWNAPSPGRRMMATPTRPSASCVSRPRFRCSPRNSAARIAVHTGMVNSIANTVASVRAPIAYIQQNWPARCITARAACTGKRLVRSGAKPRRSVIVETSSSVTSVRSARISRIPMWRSSSRTATAITANDSTAPSIHSTPRSAFELVGGWGISLWYVSRPMASDELYRKQIARLYERSPFYREKLAAAGFVSPQDAGGLADIGGLPFTEKAELRASQAGQPPLGAHAAIDLAQVARLYSTSGTSGTPLYIPLSKNDGEQWREIGRMTYSCNGLNAG